MNDSQDLRRVAELFEAAQARYALNVVAPTQLAPRAASARRAPPDDPLAGTCRPPRNRTTLVRTMSAGPLALVARPPRSSLVCPRGETAT